MCAGMYSRPAPSGALLLSSMQIMSRIGFVLSVGILIQAVPMVLIVAPTIKSFPASGTGG